MTGRTTNVEMDAKPATRRPPTKNAAAARHAAA